MSSLVALAYRDTETAERVRTEVAGAVKEHLLELEDAVVVERREDGKIKLHKATRPGAVGAAGGALWGGLIGLIFLAPVLGMAIGAAAGGVGGQMTDVGIDDEFLKTLGTRLEPGGAALLALGSSGAPDKVIERLRPFGGEVIQTSLDADQEEHLRAALGTVAAPAPSPPRAAAPATDPIEQLKELADLRAQGVLTDQEFAAQEARIWVETVHGRNRRDVLGVSPKARRERRRPAPWRRVRPQ
jgi:uncharacterized membrane protein